MSSFKPMLGCALDDIQDMTFPKICSYKLDGFRGIWWGREFMSRKLLTIPNRQIAQMMLDEVGEEAPRLDGELIAGNPFGPSVFDRTRRILTTRDADASSVRYFCFDNLANPDAPYQARVASLPYLNSFVVKLPQLFICNIDELLEFEATAIEAGYEGVIARDPNAPYKFGRSTPRQQGLVKIKRFTDDEARIIAFEELEHNLNDLVIDATGYAKRSSEMSGKVPGGTLGALVCSWHNKEFRIGSGFTQELRAWIWAHRPEVIGRKVTFKYQEVGTENLPRSPIFKSFATPFDR